MARNESRILKQRKLFLTNSSFLTLLSQSEATDTSNTCSQSLLLSFGSDTSCSSRPQKIQQLDQLKKQQEERAAAKRAYFEWLKQPPTTQELEEISKKKGDLQRQYDNNEVVWVRLKLRNTEIANEKKENDTGKLNQEQGEIKYCWWPGIIKLESETKAKCRTTMKMKKIPVRLLTALYFQKNDEANQKGAINENNIISLGLPSIETKNEHYVNDDGNDGNDNDKFMESEASPSEIKAFVDSVIEQMRKLQTKYLQTDFTIVTSRTWILPYMALSSQQTLKALKWLMKWHVHPLQLHPKYELFYVLLPYLLQRHTKIEHTLAKSMQARIWGHGQLCEYQNRDIQNEDTQNVNTPNIDTQNKDNEEMIFLKHLCEAIEWRDTAIDNKWKVWMMRQWKVSVINADRLMRRSTYYEHISKKEEADFWVGDVDFTYFCGMAVVVRGPPSFVYFHNGDLGQSDPSSNVDSNTNCSNDVRILNMWWPGIVLRPSLPSTIYLDSNDDSSKHGLVLVKLLKLKKEAWYPREQVIPWPYYSFTGMHCPLPNWKHMFEIIPKRELLVLRSHTKLFQRLQHIVQQIDYSVFLERKGDGKSKSFGKKHKISLERMFTVYLKFEYVFLLKYWCQIITKNPALLENTVPLLLEISRDPSMKIDRVSLEQAIQILTNVEDVSSKNTLFQAIATMNDTIFQYIQHKNDCALYQKEGWKNVHLTTYQLHQISYLPHQSLWKHLCSSFQPLTDSNRGTKKLKHEQNPMLCQFTHNDIVTVGSFNLEEEWNQTMVRIQSDLFALKKHQSLVYQLFACKPQTGSR
ncbi:hypothetical protein RFI_02336 [Reticulomyxa filosa]|uniref:Uncharacterized protein n=1 Tax=Reticulomyxa filosa TaxID=46433 RepID=X6P9L4_RETFI|nr:hypothetical protein RFI_02336 [Reticulomyxa filosa]|eukprot:ETO34759.1 hypothetical protein RFI_02336 [Reticulomyxa filosa]